MKQGMHVVSLYNKVNNGKKLCVLFTGLTWEEAEVKCDEINASLGHGIRADEFFTGNCMYCAMFE